jgi:hypothetical protein
MNGVQIDRSPIAVADGGHIGILTAADLVDWTARD